MTKAVSKYAPIQVALKNVKAYAEYKHVYLHCCAIEIRSITEGCVLYQK